MRIEKERNSEDATHRMYARGSGLQKFSKSEVKTIEVSCRKELSFKAPSLTGLWLSGILGK